MLTTTCRWEWWSLRPSGTIRGFCCRCLRDWRPGILGSAWRRGRWSLLTEGMIPRAIMSSCIGTAEFRSYTNAGCRTAICMMAFTLRRECRPVWAGGRCRISALILTPGITCTFARRAVAPGVKRCGLFPLVMTRRGRTRRMTSGCSAGASGEAAWRGRRCTPSGGA